jgi:hypothetical protein
MEVYLSLMEEEDLILVNGINKIILSIMGIRNHQIILRKPRKLPSRKIILSLKQKMLDF